jgi:tRNA threonylcarbamoyladenosine biosynthesis protein TsaB
MPILGIETATAVCGVALVDRGRVIAESEVEERNVHAEQLLPRIDEVLDRACHPVSALDGVAVSIGPGSFTGLRIGLSVAKGLTAVIDRPILAVQTLTALAMRALEGYAGTDDVHLLATLDARRDEVYCQLFARTEGTVSPLWEPQDIAVGALVRKLDSGRVLLTGDGRHKVYGAATQAGQTVAGRFELIPATHARCSAATVARIGERMLGEGELAESSSLEPMYIKEFFFANRQK